VPRSIRTNRLLSSAVAVAIAISAASFGGQQALAAPPVCRTVAPQATADALFDAAVEQAHAGCLIESWETLKRADSLAAKSGGRAEIAGRAVKDARQRLASNPKDVMAVYRIAFARYFLDQKGEALQAMLRAAALEPNNAWTTGYIGYVYGERGDVNSAIAWWERGIRIDPRNAVIHYMLGLAYSRKGQSRKAARHFAAAYRDRTLYEYVKGQRRL
jgi:predicted Zn-dependent protease